MKSLIAKCSECGRNLSCEDEFGLNTCAECEHNPKTCGAEEDDRTIKTICGECKKRQPSLFKEGFYG